MANTIKKFVGNSVLSAEYGEQVWIDGETSYWSIDDDAPVEAFGEMEVSVVSADELALVKQGSQAVAIIDSEIQMTIREAFSVDDELSALRTGNTNVASAIAAIVAVGSAKKAALGF